MCISSIGNGAHERVEELAHDGLDGHVHHALSELERRERLLELLVVEPDVRTGEEAKGGNKLAHS